MSSFNYYFPFFNEYNDNYNYNNNNNNVNEKQIFYGYYSHELEKILNKI